MRRVDIDRAHFEMAAHHHAVRISRRHPQRERGRHDPGRFLGLDPHHAADRMDELSAPVDVKGNFVAVAPGLRHRRDRARGVIASIAAVNRLLRGMYRYQIMWPDHDENRPNVAIWQALLCALPKPHNDCWTHDLSLPEPRRFRSRPAVSIWFLNLAHGRRPLRDADLSDRRARAGSGLRTPLCRIDRARHRVLPRLRRVLAAGRLARRPLEPAQHDGAVLFRLRRLVVRGGAVTDTDRRSPARCFCSACLRRSIIRSEWRC